MKKKLCFVLDQFLYGGIERILINYLNELDKNKYDIDIIILSDTEEMVKQIPSECNIIYKNIKRTNNPLSRASTMVRRTAGGILYYGTYLLKKIFIYPIDYFKLLDVRQKKYDVAIAFSGHFNDAYVVLNFLKAHKKVVWAHGMIYQYLLMSPAFEKMYRKFDTIACINHLDQNDIFYCKPYLNYNIVNIYNPILSSISKTLGSNIEAIKKRFGNFILTVARLDEPKDFKTLINAYNALNDEIKEKYKLVILGDGPLRDDIENQIKKLNLENNIFLEGNQDNVSKYYQAASLFILSSKADGLPTVIIEAMANGTPVISTDAPYGPRDIIQNNDYGILCPVGDVKKMTDAIEEMLNNKTMQEKYIKKGYLRCKDFDSKKIIKEFEDKVLK